MRPDIASLAPSGFSSDSRIWIFQAHRPLTENETEWLRAQLKPWVTDWKAHAEPVKGWAEVLFQQFMIFVADTAVVPVSGCSMDKLMRFVQRLGHALQVNWFDRLQIALWQNGKISSYPLDKIEEMWASGQLDADTFYFNNTIQTLAAWRDSWILPLQEGWLGERLGMQVA
ncbi:hypothetical protein BXY57_1358 [Thermoflavifilum aggregans]|uniref:Uncharacterized protein n=1 Tax=Thermoflavifilum aggregans TaxID=454188 RepID=A0A2M9CV26_9BACT|nr:hypothetical protein [Thermoflavifilum aggregans]PJJ75770.1 hypothetical protein BXY57_1358 [Thermoflavifilum aggregans]